MSEDLDTLASASPASFSDALWKASSKPVAYLETADNALKGMQRKEMSPDEKKQLRRQSQQDIKSLNLAWLGEMVNSDAQLREKMALFWHGHFASRNLNIFYQQLLLDTIRKGALGNFGDLLREVSKSAAMINFLNNNQNKKGHPNENFAREVMELFTMGRGNYTEEDVKEAARAFTGWGAGPDGSFVFRQGQHDDGDKKFLGKTGRLDGDDILNILLEQRQTALYVTRKLYRYLVSEVVDEEKVAWLAGRWYQSNYNIQSLLQDIFHSDWFFDPRNIGCRIKSPVDLLVGIRRLLPMTIDNGEVQLILQRLLGQLLFYPPNVAGWPGGANWIDSSTLMFRLQIPQLIFTADAIRLRPKDDDDQMMGMQEQDPQNAMNMQAGRKRGYKGGMGIRATIDWTSYLKRFEKVPGDQLIPAISATVLQTPSGIGNTLLQKYGGGGSREEFVKTATIRLMSTPEYQLC